MNVACPIPADAPLVASLLGTVDCQAQALLAGGYAALSSPDGAVAGAITGLLTLFVGFFGYQLMLGRTRLDAGQATMMAVKVGLVLVLAGNWAIYQQVVARTLFDAPDQLAGIVLGAIDRRGSVLSAVPLDALQQVFDELIRDVRSLSGHAGDRSPLLGGAGFAAMMLNGSAYTVVMASAGALAAIHVGLALLLALGPVVAGFLLFDATRGVLLGWLRAAATLSLASLAIAILLPIELLVLEPTLVRLANDRVADTIMPEVAMKAALVVAIFTLATLGAMIGAFVIARGLRLGAAGVAPAPGAITAPGVAGVAMPAVLQPRVARIAAAAGADPAGRRATAAAGTATALQSAFAAADRVREHGLAAAAAPGHPVPISRAVRPRRELLVARRKK